MFTQDSRTENFLKSLGVDFNYSNNVKWNQLRSGWEGRNVARPVPIREEAVEEYATLMQEGSAAPACILQDIGRERLDVLDGVQRLAAAQINGTTLISAYIVSTDSEEMAMMIRVMANARLQGRAEPLEWTRRRAVEELVVKLGQSAREVARLGGWRVADIERIAKAMEWTQRLQAIGGPDSMSDAMAVAIARHAEELDIERVAAPVARFCKTLQSSKLSVSDAEAYIEEFFKPICKQGKAFQVFTERAEKFELEPEIVARTCGRRGYEISADVNLRRILRSAATVASEIKDSGGDLTYIDEYFKLLKDIHEALHAIAVKHKKPVKTRVPADMWKD